MGEDYEALYATGKIGVVFKTIEDEKRFVEEWEKIRTELISKYGKRLEEIYLVKEEKAP